MNWTLIAVVANLILEGVVLGFWKPWAAAYGGEKGKNLARKEDLDAILAEVRAVTITQKEIESKLAGDLWDRQMRWNQKKDVYGELIKTAHEIRSVSSTINSIGVVTRAQSSPTEQGNLQLSQKLMEELQKLNIAQGTLSHLTSLAYIFTSNACVQALHGYVSAHKPWQETSTDEWGTNEVQLLVMLAANIVAAAKEDLGLLKPT